MSLLDNASLVLTPNAVKASKLYSVIPSNGNGDFTATRATTATRINSSGLVESVALNVPRLDYSLGGCPNILLEPQRTNLALQSSSFDSAVWFKSTGIVVTPNAAISPSGVMDADIVDFGAANRLITQSTTATTGVSLTGTFYIKGIAGQTINIAVAGVDQAFTLDGTWQRLGHTRTTSGTVLGLNLNTFGTSTARVVSLWGAQLEVGAYATSFIPTTTASVTRNADVLTRNNIYTNGLISASGGTWYFELKNNISLTRSAGADINQSLGVSNGTDSGLVIRTAGTSRAQIYKYVSGSPILMRTTAADVVKVAIKWNGTSADIFENGVKVVSASSFTTTNMNFLQGSAVDFPKYISAMWLEPTPLSDAELIQATTI